MLVLACAQLALAGELAYRAAVLPPMSSMPSSFVTGLGEAGQVIGYGGDDTYTPLAKPVLGGLSGFKPLPALTESLNFPLGLNEASWVAGSTSNMPIIWIDGKPSELYTVFGWAPGFAWDVNGNGRVVGSLINDLLQYEYPVYWPDPNSSAEDLPLPAGAFAGGAFAVNEAGQIAGAGGLPSGSFGALRWDDPTQPPLEVGMLSGGANSEAVGINEKGDVVGRTTYANFSIEAMLYRSAEKELVGLGFLSGNYSFAWDVNDDRVVVGDANTSVPEARAFVWKDGVMHDLNDLVVCSNEPLGTLVSARAINNAGWIAAEAVSGSPPNQVRRAVLLAPASSVPGDLDGDGHVTQSDLGLLLADYGCDTGPLQCPGDLDCDGVTGQSDLGILLANYGA